MRSLNAESWTLIADSLVWYAKTSLIQREATRRAGEECRILARRIRKTHFIVPNQLIEPDEWVMIDYSLAHYRAFCLAQVKLKDEFSIYYEGLYKDTVKIHKQVLKIMT